MAKGYQKLIIVGNLGGDPEMRYTSSGQAVTNFSVAVNNSWADSNGEVHESTTWYRISAWSKLAETCNKYLAKGRKVLVEGKLTPDKETGGPRVWQDQNGKWRASYEVTAFDVQFMDSANGNGNSRTAGVEEFDETITEDEIPF